MPLEDVLAKLMELITATEALAALGAELALQQPGVAAPPEIAAALRAVSTAAGFPDVTELPPPQQAMVAGMIDMYLRHAAELVENPGRGPAWSYTDPVILDGWGRGSSMVPSLIAGAHPDLGDVESFLDVGTGVGLLAVAAANVWPSSKVVGIDTWETSLERARANVAHAGLDERITLRAESFASLGDVEAYDCVWIPTFFLSDADLAAGLPAVERSLRPGGWVVLGRFRNAPDPLVNAVSTLRTLRNGGTTLDTKRAAELLEQAGFADVHQPPLPPHIPMELSLGQRPAR